METLNITARDFIDEPTLSSHDNMDEYRRAGICYITDVLDIKSEKKTAPVNGEAESNCLKVN